MSISYNKRNKAIDVRFRAGEDGSMTVLGLFFFMCMAMVGAFALDMANVAASRTHLQTAADQGSHAAIYNRALMDAQNAKLEALNVMQASLPVTKYGDAALVENIEFGEFDHTQRTFRPDPSSVSAVRVRTSFSEATSNPLRTYLMKLVGVDSFNLSAEAVFATYQPACLREGFAAEGVVHFQSRNDFSRGFCIHSNDYVSMRNHNSFENGTIVSMPDIQKLDSGAMSQNPGLEAALRSGSMDLRVLSRLDSMIARYENPNGHSSGVIEELPYYIKNDAVLYSTMREVDPQDLERGRVHYIDCTGNKGLTIDARDNTLREVVVISPCNISFRQGSAIENARVISKSRASNSISASSGLRIGQNDNCAEGGGAQLITMGGMHFAAQLEIFGSQLLALGDISITAQVLGDGASVISQGSIRGRTHMDMGLCLNGMEDNIEVPYFRLVL